MEDLSTAEKTMLIQYGIQAGQEVTIWRDFQHISTLHPRPHTDAVLVRYEGGGQFTILDVEHIEEL